MAERGRFRINHPNSLNFIPVCVAFAAQTVSIKWRLGKPYASSVLSMSRRDDGKRYIWEVMKGSA